MVEEKLGGVTVRNMNKYNTESILSILYSLNIPCINIKKFTMLI